MINLLPPRTREAIGYARRNSILFRWMVVMAVTLIVTVFIILSGLLYLNQTTKTHEKRAIALSESLKNQNIDETQKKVEEVSNNIKLATQVLSKEVLFSKLLNQLGAALPADTALTQLQIENVQGGISLAVGATDITAATQVQLNLADPNNKLFDKADIESISCEPNTEKQYPCIVQVRALFTKNNPFMFISPQVGAKTP